MLALSVGYSAMGQVDPMPLAVSGDPVMQLFAWAIGNYGITGAIAIGLGYLLGKKGGIPVRLSDEDRELLKK